MMGAVNLTRKFNSCCIKHRSPSKCEMMQEKCNTTPLEKKCRGNARTELQRSGKIAAAAEHYGDFKLRDLPMKLCTWIVVTTLNLPCLPMVTDVLRHLL